MRLLSVRNESRAGALLGDRIGLANNAWTRLRGLLGRPPLDRGEGLLLDPCKAVHMFGMRQALDVAFLSASGDVVAVYPDLRPGQRSRFHREARQALELPVGTLVQTDTQIGDRLAIEDVHRQA